MPLPLDFPLSKNVYNVYISFSKSKSDLGVSAKHMKPLVAKLNHAEGIDVPYIVISGHLIQLRSCVIFLC